VGQANLPVASGEKHAQAFERCGWTRLTRRGRGKHFLLTKAGATPTLSIPDHPEVKRALLAAQLKLAGISEADYLANFRR
jgi:hypothetical protein